MPQDPVHIHHSSPELKTLPDHLAPGQDVVFVGINPSLYSTRVGHYFAAPRNRFGTAVNRSELLPSRLKAADDHQALKQGFGFTDVVKRSSSGASDLRVTDYRRWAPVLKEKLERFQPSSYVSTASWPTATT